MRRDSIIWVSAGAGWASRACGPCSRRDSVRVLNRLEKEYFAGGYDYLSKLLNVPVSFDADAGPAAGRLPARLPAGTTPTAGHRRRRAPARALPAGQRGGGAPAASQHRPRAAAEDDRRASKRNLTRGLHRLQAAGRSRPTCPLPTPCWCRPSSATGVVTAAINYNKVNVGRERLAFPFAVPKGLQAGEVSR
ncbi:MAG: DUF4292 domain-containing protein [Hymenobacter sp.]